jgi:ANTAR domain/GAF domain
VFKTFINRSLAEIVQVITGMRLESQLGLFCRVSGIVSSNLTLKEMLNELNAIVRAVTECDACGIYLLDSNRESPAKDIRKGFLSVPLIASGTAIGVIHIHHSQSRQQSPQEVAFLTFLAEQMGSAISKARLVEENARLMSETLELKRQLEERKVMERAKGILQYRRSLTEEEAYLQLRNESRRLRRPMKDLAEAVILAEELQREGKEN